MTESREPKSLPHPSAPYGANAHVANDELLAQLRHAGLGWVRIDVDWDTVEPSEGEFNWTEVDRVIETCSRLDLLVLASVAYAPPWASRDGRRTGAPRDVGLWRSFVETCLRRHERSLAAVSFGNEPNLRQFFTGTREEYLRDVLTPGLELARDVTPRILRCGPDLSSSRSAGDPVKQWLAPILDRCGALLDVITHHQYDGRDTVTGRAKEIDKLHEVLTRRGDSKPLWITEIGWDTRSGVTEEAQAMNLRGVMREMRKRPWWEKTFWYDSHGAGWGIFETDVSPRRGEPRAAYRAYAEEVAAVGPIESEAEHTDEDARVIVEHAYRGILGREPDLAGLEAYAEDLERGGSIERQCQALFQSSEFRTSRSARSAAALAMDLYLGILERRPDEGGWAETVAAVQRGELGMRAAAMLKSPEFTETFLGGLHQPE